MSNKAIRIGLGILVSVVALYFMWQWLYIDICLDRGGSIHNGVCHDENYHETYIIVETPLLIIAAIFSIGCTMLVSWLLAKVTNNGRS